MNRGSHQRGPHHGESSMETVDHYAVLELEPSASSDDVLQAYDRLRQLFAEDAVATYALFGDSESAEQRKRLERAYEVLSNDSLRQDYHARKGIQTPTQSKRTERSSDRTQERSTQRSQSSSTSSTSSSTSMTRPPATEQTTTSLEPSKPQSNESHSEPVAVKASQPEAPEPAETEQKADQQEAQAAEQEQRIAEQSTTFVSAAQPAVEAGGNQPTPSDAPLAATSDYTRQDGPMEEASYSGGVLSRVRENAGLSLEAIAAKTKISMPHLRAIEGNLYDKLPARVYVRGFVTQYARCLGLPADRVADSYLQIYDRYHQQHAQAAPAKK